MRDNPDEPVFVISVAARLAGLPTWVLRMYDAEGLVVPRRTEKNRRLYSQNDIARLQFVKYLHEERGVNVAGVRVILEMQALRALGDPDGAMELLQGVGLRELLRRSPAES